MMIRNSVEMRIPAERRRWMHLAASGSSPWARSCLPLLAGRASFPFPFKGLAKGLSR
jgi:hypothetical protein